MRSSVIAVLAALILSAGASWGAASQGSGSGPGPGGGPGTFSSQNFPEMKARVLQMLEERKTRLEQEKACVERATNHEELRNCRPQHQMGPGGPGGGMPGGGFPGGGGQQRPGPGTGQ